MLSEQKRFSAVYNGMCPPPLSGESFFPVFLQNGSPIGSRPRRRIPPNERCFHPFAASETLPGERPCHAVVKRIQDRAQTRRYPVQKTEFPPPAPIHPRIGEKPLGTQSERSISLSTQCQCLSDGTTGDILVSERILLLRTVQIFKRINRPFGCIDSGRAVRSRPTVKDEVFRRETNPVTACQPYPEIEVFPYLHPFRKPPELLINATRNDRRRGLANIGTHRLPEKVGNDSLLCRMYVGVFPVAAHDVERSRLGTSIGILFYQECHLF